MRVQRKWIVGAFAMIAVVACALVAAPRLSFHQLTGHWSPIRQIEVLQSPRPVTGWSENGLHLADGRTLQLPGFRKLPGESRALNEVTRWGVEVAGDGRIYGLVRVHHWCGNDPVREHKARVDVANMLVYLRTGEWSTQPPADAMEFASPTPGGRFTDFGWEAGEFLTFQHWSALAHPSR